jgi:lipopolysaccharide transport system permease protein
MIHKTNAPLFEASAEAAIKPIVFVQSGRKLFDLDLGAIWQYRELLYFLAWREVKVRYKQTVIGVAWAILQPLMTMFIFTLIFGTFVKIPSDGIPYPLFAYAGLLPWTYFSEATVRSSGSLVSDANLLRKVYFPRLIIPLAAAITPAVDLALAFLVMLGLMVWYGVTPTANALFLPLFLALAFAIALAVGLWLSALNVKYRDIRHTVPFVVQVWMYATPIVYPISMVPENWRFVLALNPMAGIIEGFRWGLLGKESPDFSVMTASTLVVIALLFSGWVFFRRMERIFADVV